MRLEKIGKTWSFAIRNEYLSKKHWHNELEILYVMEGSTRVNVDDTEYLIQKDEMLLISSGAVHCYVEPGRSGEICVIRLTEDLLKGLSPQTRDHYRTFYSDILLLRRDKRLQKIIDDLQKVPEVDDEVYCESIILSKFFELSSVLLQDEAVIQKRKTVKRNNDSIIRDKMENYLRVHRSEKINLTEIAEYLGFSESYCSKYIKKKTSMNFLEYLNNERVEHAKMQLRMTDAPITEIAYMAGFTSIQSFNRVFKSFCEVSPSEYRKRLKDQER